MSLRLIIEDDEGTTTVVPLAADTITIGRQQGNTIQLTEKNVSRRHARLSPESDGWIIEDLNSYNGIKVNGQAAEGRLALREGDVIQIGDYHLALTEDVDKRTLNYDPRGAANNDPSREPLLASSSSDLPRMTAEELAALSSGPQPIQPPIMLMDSGPVPAATGLPASYLDDSQERSSKGLLVGVGIALLGIATGVGVWLASEDSTPTDKVALAKDAPNRGASDRQAGAGAVTPSADPSPPPDTPSPTPTNPVVDPADDPPPETPEATTQDAGAVEDDSGQEDDPGPDAALEDPDAKSVKKVKKPKPVTKPVTEPPKPPPPAADPDELLVEARKLTWNNPQRAYALAKQSYGIKRSQDTLAVMVAAACRMGDAAKAKAAFKQLKKGRETYYDSCKRNGIELE
jgi:hypothetical protein